MSDHSLYLGFRWHEEKYNLKFVEIKNNDATPFALFQNEVASAMASHVFANVWLPKWKL